MNLIIGALKSRTIWINSILAGTIVAIETWGNGLVALGLEPTETALVIAGVNWVLRYLTDKSLEAKALLQ